MVFGGQITFSTPPKTISAPKNFFGPTIFFPPFATNHVARHMGSGPRPNIEGGGGGEGGGEGGGGGKPFFF